MTTQTFLADLLDFLDRSNELAQGTILEDTRLIDDGYVDSFSIMQLLAFIEERTGTAIAIETLSLETIHTPRVIAETYGHRIGVEA